MRLFDYDDRGIDQFTASDGETSQRHYVDAYTRVVERDKGQQHGHRDRHDGNHRTGKVAEKDQDDQNDSENDLDQRPACVGDRTVDQFRTVVHRDYFYSVWQTRRDVVEAALHSTNHFERVAAVAHNDNSGYDFPGAVQVAGATSNIRTDNYVSNILNPNGRTVDRSQNDLLDVRLRTHVAATANHVFGAAKIKHARARLAVAGANRIGHTRDGNTVGTQAVGVDVDLILLRESTERSHIRHARHRLQIVLEIPILIGAEFA